MLFKIISVIGSLTFVSRILGYTRDLLIARVIGAGLISDCFFVAFKLPNLFRRLFGEGAMNSAFIPILSGIRSKSTQRKTDIFFPTHRETQGMVAQEIAACGGITMLQAWMYPTNTLSQFAHILYKQDDYIDFLSIKENIKNITYEKIRNHTLEKCNFEKFRNTLYQALLNLITKS